MTNRSIKPHVIDAGQIVDLSWDEYELANGMKVFCLNEPEQELLKVEFLFYAGSYFQQKKLVAAITSNMLKEGTATKSSAEISEIFDYYGVYASFEPQKDFVSVNFFVLEKHLEPVLQLMEEILKTPSFPEGEMNTIVSNLRQQYVVSLNKVASVARMNFGRHLFGEAHPYGQVLDIDDFDFLSRIDLVDFHKQHYNASNVFCVIAGGQSERIIPLFEKYFGGNDWQNKDYVRPVLQNNKLPLPIKEFIPKDDAMQSAIRIGKTCPGISHPDYHGIMITNVILGGYFGSRLMKNIRQEKGYTYGINSSVISLLNNAYFFITSQVGADVCSKATEEVYAELKNLRSVPVGEEELNIVRNYLSGTMLRSFDGVFEQAERLKEVIAFDLCDSHFEDFRKVLSDISGEDVMNFADKYFNEKDMSELIVGKQ